MARQIPHKTITYYDILEVSPSAKDEDIRQAYRRLVMQWHPDRNRMNERIADFKLKSINEAYAHLKDRMARTRYDQMLKRQRRSITAGNDNSGDQSGVFRQLWTWLFMSDRT